MIGPFLFTFAQNRVGTVLPLNMSDLLTVRPNPGALATPPGTFNSTAIDSVG